MALVDYASSDEDENENEDSSTTVQTPTNLKRKREDEPPSDLPPLPSKFHDLYASTTRLSTTDDPSLHGGRKRVTPHLEGNWPTHLYIEWYPSTAEYDSLTKMISILEANLLSENFNVKIHSFLTSDLGAPLPLHISLSRPIGFATEQKEDFVISLDRAINRSGIRPFEVSFSSLDWVANFENTRWFLVLRIQKPATDGLNKLLHVSNTIVQDYGQPPLYLKSIKAGKDATTKNNRGPRAKPDRRNSLSKKSSMFDWGEMKDASDAFHVSIAWTLEAPSQKLVELTNSRMSEEFEEFRQTHVKIEEIKSKVGNAVSNMPLRKSVVEGKGLFGL